MQTEIKQSILDRLESLSKALSVFDLSDMLDTGVEIVQPALNDLCAEGRVVITKKGKYALPELLGLISARASALRSGAPTVIPLDGSPSMKIVSLGRMRPLPDDSLLVRRLTDDECELVAITARGKKELPAFVRVEIRQLRQPHTKHHKHRDRSNETRISLTATACDRRISCPIVITPGGTTVRNDEIALLAIDVYPEADRPMQAHVIRVLGDKSDMKARLKVIAEGHAFPSDFPQEVLDHAEQLDAYPDPLPREDLRSLMLFTIDGPFSKDFDDAVSLDRAEDGTLRLGVHIADVSHYVRPGSAIDREAFDRGTSLYLPGLTVPMLPEILSNDLCSLVPQEDRLALSLFMGFRDGKVIDHHLCPSIIHSKARLTYDAVNRFFDGDASAVPHEVQDTLREMLTLSRTLRSRRFSKGCIELDLPESEFVLDENTVPTDISRTERGEAERLIEDFMLTANETVAMIARTTETPLVYRVHGKPDTDRISELSRYLANVGVQCRLTISPHPGELQQIIESTREHPAADSIQRVLLRSMQRAEYSEQPLGHYALALEDYCHFTSPIRRYPDLVVHRMLKKLLTGASVASDSTRMSAIARQSSQRELEATFAEREADDLMKARYMQQHIGRRFTGVVTSVTAWGLYVTLENSVEGLVHIATLDDYYEFDRDRCQLVATGSGNVFRLGDRVRIRVEYADLERGEIDFTLVPFARQSSHS